MSPIPDDLAPSEAGPNRGPPSVPPGIHDNWWRRIVWIFLAAAVAAPPVLLGGFFSTADFHECFAWPGLKQHPGVLVADVAVTVGLAALGLWRGWHARPRLLLVWGIAAGVIFGLGALAAIGSSGYGDHQWKRA